MLAQYQLLYFDLNIPQNTISYLPSLTGLRAVAATLVYIHHYNPFPANTWLHRIAQEGYIGVTLFFVLSGFVITWNYASRWSQPTFSLRDFYVARFARIFPLYWVLLLLLYTILIFKNGPTILSWSDLWAHVFLLKGWFPSLAFQGISQSWSLTVEVGFYVLAPWWIRIVAQQKWIQLVGLFAFFLIFLFVFYSPNLAFGSFYTLLGRFFEFSVGIFIALSCSHASTSPQPRYATILGILLSVAIVGMYIMAIDKYHFPTFQVEWILYNICLPLSLGVFVKGLVKEASFIRKLLSHKWFLVLGNASYAFYLIHLGPFPVIIQRFITTQKLGQFIILWMLAMVFYFFIEKPLQRTIIKYTKLPD